MCTSSDNAAVVVTVVVGVVVVRVVVLGGASGVAIDAANGVGVAGVLSSDGATLYIGLDRNVSALNTAGTAPSLICTAFAAELDTA